MQPVIVAENKNLISVLRIYLLTLFIDNNFRRKTTKIDFEDRDIVL